MMPTDRVLRPRDLARAADISVQTVRDYEDLGFIPASARSAGGHRQYHGGHLDALMIARTAIRGFGWATALEVMQAVHRGDSAAALALVDACHARLHHRRERLDELIMLIPLGGEASERVGRLVTHPRMRSVSEAAKEVGVRPSALRFWEQQGLLQPERAPGNGFRRYDERQMHRLRIVATLRDADYRFETIRAVLDELAAGRPEAMSAALEAQRRTLDDRSRNCTAATAALWDYLRTQPAC